MSKTARIFLMVAVIAIGLVWLIRHRLAPADGNSSNAAGGGRLVVTSRTEPKNFNRYVTPDAATDLFSQLTQATLVRLNRATGVLEPRLAREWTMSSDGLSWTLKLRDDVVFSDGVPFTSADVVFSFDALYDPRVASPIASAFLIDGRPLAARPLDDHTVVITFPAPPGPGLAMLDTLPMLPRHSLADALHAGDFAKVWALTTPPGSLVGLGPFVLTEYVPGERLRFSRNTHYWRHDDQSHALPYLDGIDLSIMPDQSAELLRFESGDVDLMTDTDQVRAADLGALKQEEHDGHVQLADVGVSPDANVLWLNLATGSPHAKGRPWLQREELRRAISYGVDRNAIINAVYLGQAEPIYGPVTPGHGQWFLPDLPKTDYDPAKAKSLLSSIGLVDRNGSGVLTDASGRPARIAITTEKGNAIREQTVAVIQSQLSKIGLAVDIVALERGAVVKQFQAGDYDAIFFGFQTDSPDPARNLDYWLSSGSFHVWNPGQKTPATPWEAQIDTLMKTQETTLDSVERRRLFARVQNIFAEHLPALYFAAPKVTVAMSKRLLGATPVVLKPHVLWNAEMLRLASASSGRR